MFNRSNQGELHSGSKKILFGILYLKIAVACKIITVKAKAELKADQAGTVHDQSPVLGGEQIGGAGEISRPVQRQTALG